MQLLFLYGGLAGNGGGVCTWLQTSSLCVFCCHHRVGYGMPIEGRACVDKQGGEVAPITPLKHRPCVVKEEGSIGCEPSKKRTYSDAVRATATESSGSSGRSTRPRAGLTPERQKGVVDSQLTALRSPETQGSVRLTSTSVGQRSPRRSVLMDAEGFVLPKRATTAVSKDPDGGSLFLSNKFDPLVMAFLNELGVEAAAAAIAWDKVQAGKSLSFWIRLAGAWQYVTVYGQGSCR
jgi:hypothetical protein